MSEKLLFNCTHGKEDAERATLPFVAANVAEGSEDADGATVERLRRRVRSRPDRPGSA